MSKVSSKISLIIALIVLISVSGFAQEKFDPYKLKTEYFSDASIKDKLEFDHDGESFKIVNTESTKGLKIKHKGSWKYHGIVYKYYKGKLSSQTNYYYGAKEGEYKSFNSKGQLKFHYYFKNNKKHGNWTQYTDKGKLFQEYIYENDKKHGKSTMYHSNGQPQFVKTWVNVKVHGESLHYNDKGKLVSKKVYDMGNQVGKTQSF